MRIKSLFIILFLCTNGLYAQTGIGTTTPNAAAKLDVSSTTKGFLPPKVALTATNSFDPITGLSGSTALATAAGLLIYNTATVYNTNQTFNGIRFLGSSNFAGTFKLYGYN